MTGCSDGCPCANYECTEELTTVDYSTTTQFETTTATGRLKFSVASIAIDPIKFDSFELIYSFLYFVVTFSPLYSYQYNNHLAATNWTKVLSAYTVQSVAKSTK